MSTVAAMRSCTEKMTHPLTPRIQEHINRYRTSLGLTAVTFAGPTKPSPQARSQE
jgi:hypothetical protein